MAHDAQLSSLSEYDQSLERQVSDLQAILHHLLASISDTRAEVDANRARIDLCLANSAGASARAELAIKNAQEAVPIAREAALEELLKIAQAANDDGPRHAEPRGKRKRKLPSGWAGLITGVTVAVGLLKAHKAAAAAGAGALMMAASAPMAQSLLPDTDAHVPAVAAHHHFHAHHDMDPVTGAVLPPRRRQHGSPVKSVHRRRAPSPKATAPTGATTPPPSPVPSPTGSTLPEPSPAATPPVPSATPTATGVLMAPAWDH